MIVSSANMKQMATYKQRGYEMLEKMKITLFRKAILQHRVIMPCGSKKRFADCYTTENGKLYFWFNVESGTTKMLSAKIGGLN
jgi:hypothetical protein